MNIHPNLGSTTDELRTDRNRYYSPHTMRGATTTWRVLVPTWPAKLIGLPLPHLSPPCTGSHPKKGIPFPGHVTG